MVSESLETIEISIIIPAFNEEDTIRLCLDSLSAQDMDRSRFEVIVVDDGSTDATAAVAEDFGARVIRKQRSPGATISGLRNEGARASSGRLMLFLDADMILPPNLLSTANDFYQQGFEGAMQFAVTIPEDAGWVARTWGGRRKNQPADETVEVDYLPGWNIFVNRKVFDEIGGFRTELRTCEDKDFTLRMVAAGYKAVLKQSPTVLNRGYEKTLREFIRKEFWRQSATLKLARLWNFSPRTLRNPLLSLWHLLCFAALLWSLAASLNLAAVIASLLWIAPSAALSSNARSSSLTDRILSWSLVFIRWNAAAAALLWQLLKLPFQGL